MQTAESRNSPDFPENVEIIWKDWPIKMAVGVVAWMAMSSISEKWNFILLVSFDEESIKEALSLKEKNPKSRVIIVDPFSLSTRMMGANDMILLSRLTQFPFVKFMTDIEDFMAEMTACAKESDEDDSDAALSVTQAQIWFSSRILWYLRHDLPKVIRRGWDGYEVDESQRERFEKIMTDARAAFNMKEHVTESQVVRFIMETKTQIEKVMDWDIDWVYCDIDDTIIRADWTLILSTLDILEKYEKQWKAIHIWTWWELELAKEKLAGTPFERFPLVSKYDYAWANAEIVIDNVSPEKFAIQTGITAKKFIRV
ncbi:MAG: hypothetical protein ACD_2C00180G0002 [uncultured bacterium (gcode 4)]|uniref:Uncharacterized protein n=1 Tax=uncultured bacterium (gcode 4) TaxID=1234023 RepID=K2GG80_9BACT|nr:MAG: hypothetical protein ACD_2C00180G0002 [uncultured bacterium (gcode 4)]